MGLLVYFIFFLELDFVFILMSFFIRVRIFLIKLNVKRVECRICNVKKN